MKTNLNKNLDPLFHFDEIEIYKEKLEYRKNFGQLQQDDPEFNYEDWKWTNCTPQTRKEHFDKISYLKNKKIEESFSNRKKQLNFNYYIDELEKQRVEENKNQRKEEIKSRLNSNLSKDYCYKISKTACSLARHTPWVYCDVRKKMVDKFLEPLLDKPLTIDEKVKKVSRQYKMLYGEDDYFFQLRYLIIKKLAAKKVRQPDLKDDFFNLLLAKSKTLYNIKKKEGRIEQFKFIKYNMLAVFLDDNDLVYSGNIDRETLNCYGEKFDLKPTKKIVAKNSIYETVVYRLEEIDYYILDGLRRYTTNLSNRLRLALRKGWLNNFNYFCTFTHDDKKHTPESFEKALKTTLKNLSYNRGWAYMMIDEEGAKTGRLHYHAIVYVPPGEMIGELIEIENKKEYTKYCEITKQFKTRYYMQKRVQNTYFNELFGISDFDSITYGGNSRSQTQAQVNYIQKYMSKTDSRIVHSRHLPAYEIKELPNGTSRIDYLRKNGTVKAHIISGMHLPHQTPGRFSKFCRTTTSLNADILEDTG